MKKGDYVMVRTYSAGVFVGKLKNKYGREVTLTNARRIWFWKGANSLSELAMVGTSKPLECKFPVAVSEIVLFETIEILAVTPEAEKNIAKVPIWKN